ncbi:soluble NSF attachment protein, SNAP domain-containing protein [Phthorimaea operculella]|nr:soluble NSF attachment protein, SNAP domain-containing protein [Phthorimaea operculella]
MGKNEQKAIQLMAKAEKTQKSLNTFLGSLFNVSSKRQDAIDCYIRAGNLFKMEKKWFQAGQAFCNAACLLNQEVSTRFDAATNYVDAYNCYKRCDDNSEANNDAICCLLKAIEIYTDMGRFSMAAKQHESLAELYEQNCYKREFKVDRVPTEKLAFAMQSYEKAADYFQGENSVSSANKCMLKVAYWAAYMEDYEKAINIYEQIAKSSLTNSLLKSKAKEYMYRAALCHLCVDILNAQHALEKYCELYPAFEDTREYKLVKELIESLEEQNEEAFIEVIKSADSFLQDQWYEMMIARIKKQFNDKPDLL